MFKVKLQNCFLNQLEYLHNDNSETEVNINTCINNSSDKMC